MTKKEQVLGELNGYAKKDPMSFTRTIIGSEDFDFIAERIVKLFVIPDVNTLDCPDCGAKTKFDYYLGLYKCNECEWEGQHNT